MGAVPRPLRLPVIEVERLLRRWLPRSVYRFWHQRLVDQLRRWLCAPRVVWPAPLLGLPTASIRCTYLHLLDVYCHLCHHGGDFGYMVQASRLVMDAPASQLFSLPDAVQHSCPERLSDVGTDGSDHLAIWQIHQGTTTVGADFIHPRQHSDGARS